MRCSLSCLAVTGISIAQVALASPLTPQKTVNSLHGLGDHHGSSNGEKCKPLEKVHGPEVRPDDIWTFITYKQFGVHDTFPSIQFSSLTNPGVGQECKNPQRLRHRRTEYASSHSQP